MRQKAAAFDFLARFEAKPSFEQGAVEVQWWDENGAPFTTTVCATFDCPKEEQKIRLLFEAVQEAMQREKTIL